MTQEIIKRPFTKELSAVNKNKAVELSGVFTPFLEMAKAINAKAMELIVTDESQTDIIQQCHDMQMELVKIRTDADKERKRFGDTARLEVNAINGIFNVIKYCTIPAEEHLKKQKNFAKLLKEKKQAELSEKRTLELSEFKIETEYYNLGEMSEEGFQQLLKSAKIAYEQQKEAELKAEKERIAKEKEEVEERKRITEENKRLKTEAEEHERLAEIDREKQAQIEAKRKTKEEKQRLKYEAEHKKEREERERVEAILREKEAKEEKAQQEAAAKEREAKLAPDKKKLEALAVTITGLEMPEVTSKEAKDIVANAVELLNKTSNYIKQRCVDL